MSHLDEIHFSRHIQNRRVIIPQRCDSLHHVTRSRLETSQQGYEMRSTTLAGMVLGILLVSGLGMPIASEADELRERAKAVRKEASAMAERGNKEQAERLEKESVELMQAAQKLEGRTKGRSEKANRPDIAKAVQSLHERLNDLHAQERKLKETKAPEKELAEVHERIAQTERELHAIHKHHAEQAEPHPAMRGQAEQLEAASRRIHHLRTAAEHLKQAEAHELAQQVQEQANSMERDVQAAKARLLEEHHRATKGEHGPDALQELRTEVERLRAEVKELRQQSEKR